MCKVADLQAGDVLADGTVVLRAPHFIGRGRCYVLVLDHHSDGARRSVTWRTTRRVEVVEHLDAATVAAEEAAA